MNELTTYQNYEQYKAVMDRTMNETANNFVRIGYLLAVARDTGILDGSGYAGMGEFARTEYGLEESQTSRFIAIWEKYGTGEGALLEQYEGYGQAKLAEMLTLPDAVAEVLPKELTREEIREVKNEVRAEEKITQIELMLEPAKNTGDILFDLLKAYFEDEGHTREFRALFGTHDGSASDVVMDILAPSGYAVLGARVPGVGRLMLSIRGAEQRPVLSNIRENTKTEYDWEEICAALDRIIGNTNTPEERYLALYGRELPEEKKKEEKPEKRPGDEKKKKPEKKKPEKKKTEKKEKKVKIARAQPRKEKKQINPPQEEGGLDAETRDELGKIIAKMDSAWTALHRDGKRYRKLMEKVAEIARQRAEEKRRGKEAADHASQ